MMPQTISRQDVQAAMKRHSAYTLDALNRINAAASKAEAATIRREVRETEARYRTFLADALDAVGASEQSACMRAAIDK